MKKLRATSAYAYLARIHAILKDGDDVQIKDLAAFFGISKQAAGSIVASLEQEELIVRESDGHAYLNYMITERGIRLLTHGVQQ